MSDAGPNDRAEPQTWEDWILSLGAVESLVIFGVVLAWGLGKGFLKFPSRRAGPSQTLPKGVCFPCQLSCPRIWLWPFNPGSESVTLTTSVRCWIAVSCAALNSMFGLPNLGWTRRRGKVHESVMGALQSRIERFLSGSAPSNLKKFVLRLVKSELVIQVRRSFSLTL